MSQIMSPVMSETVPADTASKAFATERPAPQIGAAQDRVLPVLIVLSLIAHATMFLPSLLLHDAVTTLPKEIPVEVVQLPMPKPSVPKPPPSKPSVPKPAAQQAARQPQPKTAEAKPKPSPKPSEAAQKTGSERLKDLLGPMPAVAMPASAPDGSDAVSYTQLVLSKVAKAKKEGRYPGIPGVSTVSFTLGDTGEIAHVEIVRPSGDPSLDAEAIAMIKRGAPYPPPPPGGRRDYTVTLRFQAAV